MQIMTRGDPFSDKAVPSASQVIEDRKSLSSGTSASLVDGPEEVRLFGLMVFCHPPHCTSFKN